jgi:IS30 family transposase
MFGVRAGQRVVRFRLVAQREAYFDLVRQGVGTREACRLVGVDRKTGYLWRQELSGQVSGRPVTTAAVAGGEVSSRYLSQQDRVVIADRLREGMSAAAIAVVLGRPRCTVSREITRNRDADGVYRPHAAQLRAQARRPRPKTRKLAACPELREAVQGMLESRLSPEQISARLRRDHPGRSEIRVSAETIYQALYVQGRGGLRRELAAALRTGRAVRRPRRPVGQRPPRFAYPMVMISERPAEADDRAVPGHWEGDLIIGKDGQSAIGTLVERATRYVMLVHLPDGRTAEQVHDGLLATIGRLPQHLTRSLTWDQGAEMALHHQFATTTGMPVYFCDPHSPWQRGSNENTNGLLRQYFPKGTDLARHTAEHLDAVAAELNARPRKTLDWDTPTERLAKVLTS